MAGLERLLGDLDAEAGEPGAEREKPLLARILEQVNRPRAAQAQRATDALARDRETLRERRERNERGVRDLGVVDALGFEAIVHRQRPRDVVIGLVGGVGREGLGREKVDGVVTVRLIQPDDVSSGRELPFRDLERRGHRPDLDALGDPGRLDHVGDAPPVALFAGMANAYGLPLTPFCQELKPLR